MTRGVAHRCGYVGAGRGCQLDCGGADSASRSTNKHALTELQVGLGEKSVVGSCEGLR
jgi:hypothetical protein